MRVDWEICFHCGVRRPVARSLSATGFRVTSALLLLCLLVAAGFNVAAVWNIVRGVPAKVAEQVATAAPEAAAGVQEVVSEIPMPELDPSEIPKAGRRIASAGTRVTRPRDAAGIIDLERPTLPETPALSIPGLAADSAACAMVADSAATLDVESAAVGRGIAGCRTVEELNRLESRLRAAHPDAPALQEGGEVARRIEARRSELIGG